MKGNRKRLTGRERERERPNRPRLWGSHDAMTSDGEGKGSGELGEAGGSESWTFTLKCRRSIWYDSNEQAWRRRKTRIEREREREEKRREETMGGSECKRGGKKASTFPNMVCSTSSSRFLPTFIHSSRGWHFSHPTLPPHSLFILSLSLSLCL